MSEIKVFRRRQQAENINLILQKANKDLEKNLVTPGLTKSTGRQRQQVS